MVYGLIKDGVIKNVIVATQQFINNVPGYDYKVRIDNLVPKPGIGWAYDGNTFTAPALEVEEE